jgi:putative transposase
MPYDPSRHHRRSIRLRGYDYATPGAYFVTICTQGRQQLFGTIADGAMRPNDAGRMIERWWGELHNKFPAVRTDAFVVMPDHIHGIIMILARDDVGDRATGADRNDATNAIVDSNAGGYINPPRRNEIVDINVNNANTMVGADVPICPRRGANANHDGDGTDAGDHPPSLSQIVQWFKIMTTMEYIRQVKQAGWPPFVRRIWQRGYYEHIVRNDDALHRIHQYIGDNPIRWAGNEQHLETLLARLQAKE